jgi:hypothetical protein
MSIELPQEIFVRGGGSGARISSRESQFLRAVAKRLMRFLNQKRQAARNMPLNFKQTERSQSCTQSCNLKGLPSLRGSRPQETWRETGTPQTPEPDKVHFRRHN